MAFVKTHSRRMSDVETRTRITTPKIHPHCLHPTGRGLYVSSKFGDGVVELSFPGGGSTGAALSNKTD
jgi:hypothetical protein